MGTLHPHSKHFIKVQFLLSLLISNNEYCTCIFKNSTTMPVVRRAAEPTPKDMNPGKLSDQER
jgi:hypothetical protein